MKQGDEYQFALKKLKMFFKEETFEGEKGEDLFEHLALNRTNTMLRHYSGNNFDDTLKQHLELEIFTISLIVDKLQINSEFELNNKSYENCRVEVNKILKVPYFKKRYKNKILINGEIRDVKDIISDCHSGKYTKKDGLYLFIKKNFVYEFHVLQSK